MSTKMFSANFAVGGKMRYKSQCSEYERFQGLDSLEYISLGYNLLAVEQRIRHRTDRIGIFNFRQAHVKILLLREETVGQTVV